MLPVVGALLAVPAVLFLVLYFAFGRRAMAASVVVALVGASAGAFFASAGSAMATSVDPNEAMLRGAGVGFAASTVVAVIITLGLRALRR
jgi:hypothetical protein